MTMNAAVFDLDGTLTDPGAGILDCIKFAMERLAKSRPDDEVLARFIGPPLRVAFANLLGSSDRGLIESAVALYRGRYEQSGIYEARVYQGIDDMLRRVTQAGIPMFVATSKPAVYAERIVEHCGIAPHFSGVYGPTLDGRFDDKAALLSHLLISENLDAGSSVMVGDRAVDISAAKASGMHTIGVLWGYGTQNELSEAEADQLCETPSEVASCLQAI